MTRDRLMQLVGAQTELIDHLLAPYCGVRGRRMPPEAFKVLLRIQQLAEEPVLELEQNLIDGVWEVEA